MGSEVINMDTCCSWAQESPFGTLLVETGSKGVRSVLFDRAAGPGDAACRECRKIEAAFDRYFAGDGKALDKVPVDVSAAKTEFHRRVLRTLHDRVRAGSTTTYGELAAAAGRPGAARAVGSAMARNPVPIVVPCHRVLASGGGLGGYGGGLSMKQRLLELEGVTLGKSEPPSGQMRRTVARRKRKNGRT